MTGVSARALAVLLDTAAAHGLRLDVLTQGIEDPIGQSRRVEWEVIKTVCDRIGQQIGSPSALMKFGEELAPGESLTIFSLISQTVLDQSDLYSIGAKWLGPSLFPMIEAEIDRHVDGQIVQRLTLQNGHRQCESFFYLMAGFLAATPVQWGLRPSNVEIFLEDRGATLYIRPDLTKLGVRQKLRRWRTARSESKRLVKELAGQSSHIHQNYREARRARDRIAAQAKELEQVNAIGRELAQHIELDRVAGVLTRVLLQDLSFSGVRLELALPSPEAPDEVAAQTDDFAAFVPPSAPGTEMTSESDEAGSDSTEEVSLAPLIHVAGNLSGSPTKVFNLKTAAGPIGTLSVWSALAKSGREAKPLVSNEASADRDSVIDRLIPWISMALDNARTYRQLESHAADLQSRVLERTARLLTVNHRLVREIEERRQATEALLVSESQLRSSERMASIGTLAAGIAHEINNPVGSILAAAQLALAVQSDEDSARQTTDALTDIVAEAKRCGEIVRSVLQFSRDERTEKWDCRLQDIVLQATRITDPYTSEFGAKVITRLPDKPIWVHVNPIQIEQALVNLVRNAIEARGLEIQVVVDAVESEAITTIEVHDDGAGFSDDDQVRAFEPFYTTKREDGGTGLGLSVVHGIVKEHSGTLNAGPKSDGGASVVIQLPTVRTPPPKVEPGTSPGRRSSSWA